MKHQLHVGCAVLSMVALVACQPAPAPAELQGVIEIDEVGLAFETGGLLAQLEVQRGDPVASGAPVARLDDDLAQRRREARAAEVTALEAELALLRAGTRDEERRATYARLVAAREIEHLAGVQLARQERLVRDGAVAESTLEPHRKQVSQAAGERGALEQTLLAQRRGARPEQLEALEARLAAARAALAMEDERLLQHRLASPRDGVVIDTHFDPGELVAPGALVVTVGDRAHPYVDVFVEQDALAAVTTGRAATVTVDAFDGPFDATVEHVGTHTEFTPRYLFSEAERRTLVVRVRLRIDDPDQRLPVGVPAFATWADG